MNVSWTTNNQKALAFRLLQNFPKAVNLAHAASPPPGHEPSDSGGMEWGSPRFLDRVEELASLAGPIPKLVDDGSRKRELEGAMALIGLIHGNWETWASTFHAAWDHRPVETMVRQYSIWVTCGERLAPRLREYFTLRQDEFNHNYLIDYGVVNEVVQQLAYLLRDGIPYTVKDVIAKPGLRAGAPVAVLEKWVYEGAEIAAYAAPRAPTREKKKAMEKDELFDDYKEINQRIHDSDLDYRKAVEPYVDYNDNLAYVRMLSDAVYLVPKRKMPMELRHRILCQFSDLLNMGVRPKDAAEYLFKYVDKDIQKRVGFLDIRHRFTGYLQAWCEFQEAKDRAVECKDARHVLVIEDSDSAVAQSRELGLGTID